MNDLIRKTLHTHSKFNFFEFIQGEDGQVPQLDTSLGTPVGTPLGTALGCPPPRYCHEGCSGGLPGAPVFPALIS